VSGVKRGRDENGDSVYTLSARLVHALILSIISAISMLGVYMVAWAYNDVAWKTTVSERQVVNTARIESLEQRVRVLEAKR
jgi:hypothetical protein